MAHVSGLRSALLVLLLAFTCGFAQRNALDTLQHVQRADIRHSSRSISTVDAVDVANIVEMLEAVVTELVNDFDEMMSLEPTAEQDEEQIPEITAEPDQSAATSSAPTASIAPSPAPLRTGSNSLRSRNSKSSTNTLDDAVVASTELEEELDEETSVEETSVEETSVEETSLEKTSLEVTSLEVTSLEETSLEETIAESDEEQDSDVPPKYPSATATATKTPQPVEQSPKPSVAPSLSSSPTPTPTSTPTPTPTPTPSPSPSPSPKEKPLRTMTFGYKGYTNSIVLMLPNSGETAEEMESFVEQLREEGFTRTKFVAVQPDEIWITDKRKKEPAWFDASDITQGAQREYQVLRATKKVMKFARGQRPIIIGFGQGGAIALTAYMRYGVDGVVSSCGGLPLLATYPRDMTDDSKDSMALVIGGDHLVNGVERMQDASREVVFLRTNQPKENGRFKEDVIGYVVGVLNRAIAT